MIFGFDCPKCGATDLPAEVERDDLGVWYVVRDVPCDGCGALLDSEAIAEKFAEQIDRALQERAYDHDEP